MRRKTAIVLCGLLAVLAVTGGCGKKSEATRESSESKETEQAGNGNEEGAEGEEEVPEAAVEEPVRFIGISLPSDDADERWSLDASTMRQKLQDNGFEARVSFSQNDSKKQRTALPALCLSIGYSLHRAAAGAPCPEAGLSSSDASSLTKAKEPSSATCCMGSSVPKGFAQTV